MNAQRHLVLYVALAVFLEWEMVGGAYSDGTKHLSLTRTQHAVFPLLREGLPDENFRG